MGGPQVLSGMILGVTRRRSEAARGKNNGQPTVPEIRTAGTSHHRLSCLLVRGGRDAVSTLRTIFQTPLAILKQTCSICNRSAKLGYLVRICTRRSCQQPATKRIFKNKTHCSPEGSGGRKAPAIPAGQGPENPGGSTSGREIGPGIASWKYAGVIGRSDPFEASLGAYRRVYCCTGRQGNCRGAGGSSSTEPQGRPTKG